MRTICIITWLLGVVFFSNGSAEACSCGKVSLAEAIAKYDAVFVGKVVKLEVTRDRDARPLDGNPADDIRATVATREIIKGQPGKVVEFSTDNGCCYCSFGFEIAEEYLLFAKKEEDGTYFTSVCSRSRMLVEAAADLKTLGIERPLREQ
jgi:Tissue inhibitor of metalloproteinase